MNINVKQRRLKQLKTFHSFSLIIRKTHPEAIVHIHLYHTFT
jgi:hypothetical protein